MKFIYEGFSQKSGIYKIVNTHTHRIYIGQTSRFDKRWGEYKRDLPSGKNHNRFFLNDYNKCKIFLNHDDFLEFHILELMENSTKEERNKREEWWIGQFWDNQNLCYNFKRKADSKPRAKNSGPRRPMSEQGKQNISISHKKLIAQNPSLLLPTIMGRKKWAQENKERIKEICSLASQVSAKKHALTITLVSPENETITITNIAEYARKHRLQPEGLMSVWKEEKLIYRDWIKPGTDRQEAIRQRKEQHRNACSKKTYVFLDPITHLPITIRNLSKFAADHGLSQALMSAVALGKRKHHKGWKALFTQS